MVNRCKAAGVDIIVDAVINHMTNFPSPGVGSNGTAYTKYSYPGLYTPIRLPSRPARVNNYQSAANVQDCELFSLPDLNTGLAAVRQKIADYLIMLARLGVAGFRIDAAKHIQQVELDDIIGRVNLTLAGEGRPLPYFYLEVIAGSGRRSRRATTSARDTARAAPPTSPSSRSSVSATSSANIGGEHISQLNPNGTAGKPVLRGGVGADARRTRRWCSCRTTTRQHELRHQLSRRQRVPAGERVDAGAALRLSVDPVQLCVHLSHRELDGPAVRCRRATPMRVTCAPSLETATIGQWVCEHRDPYIREHGGLPPRRGRHRLNHWWDDGANAIAFSRGTRASWPSTMRPPR